MDAVPAHPSARPSEPPRDGRRKEAQTMHKHGFMHRLRTRSQGQEQGTQQLTSGSVMAYGKATEEVPHVWHEVRMGQDRRLQGRLQPDARPGRTRPARANGPRGGHDRTQTGVLGVPGVRIRAHLPSVIDDTGKRRVRAARRVRYPLPMKAAFPRPQYLHPVTSFHTPISTVFSVTGNRDGKHADGTAHWRVTHPQRDLVGG